MGESASIAEVRRAYGVPDAVRLKVDEREVLAWLPGYEVAVREVAAHPDELPSAGLGGRRGLRRLPTPDGPVLVREYGKGGLLRALRGRLFRGPWRPLEELCLQRRLLALGVPVSQAVGCVVLRRPGGWRGFLVLAEVEGARDLEALLYGEPAPSGLPRREVLARAGAAVRRLHDAGVPHPDLHPKNMLAAPDGPVLVIDLDRAQPCEGLLPEATRLSNLVRLGRSVEKHRLRGARVSRRDALRFLHGYAGSLDAARVWLDRVRGRLRRGAGVRALWWRLIGETRRWQPRAPEAR